MTRLPLLCSATIAATITASATAGCGVGLDRVPLPAPGVASDAYELTATFTNALNLPQRAKVRLAGGDIGEVSAMRARDFRAVVTMRIRSETRLPVGTTAELRSATPLGDVYVALTPPADAGPATALLADHDSIPVESTAAAATVEEALTTSALLVNGGAIRDLTKIVNSLGTAVGDDGDKLADLIEQSKTLIAALAARSGEVRDALGAANQLTTALATQQSALADCVAAAAPALTTVSANTGRILGLVTEIDRISAQLGRFPSIRGADSRSTIADLNALSDVFQRMALDPEADLDVVNRLFAPLIKATSSTSAHADIDVAGVALGAVPDPGHAADPGMRPPDLGDWNYLVGSVEYLLRRLHDRVTGGGR